MKPSQAHEPRTAMVVYAVRFTTRVRRDEVECREPWLALEPREFQEVGGSYLLPLVVVVQLLQFRAVLLPCVCHKLAKGEKEWPAFSG